METNRSNRTQRKIPTKLVVVSLLSIIIWAVMVMVYTLVWSRGYNLFQNLVVVLVSLVLTGLVVGLMWILWGPTDWSEHRN